MIATLIFASLGGIQSGPAPVINYETIQDAANRSAMSIWVPKPMPTGYAIAYVQSQKLGAAEMLGLPGRTVIHFHLLNKMTKHSLHIVQTAASPKVSARDHGKWLLNGTGFRLEFKTGNAFAVRRYSGRDFLVTGPMMTERALATTIQSLVEVKPR